MEQINESILICNFEDFKKALNEEKIELNPLEKVMAIELLLNDYNFYCQYKINLFSSCAADKRQYFIVDFFIPEMNLIIETDGKIHLSEENQIKDRNKNNCLTYMGYRIFHFSWDEIMKNIENYDIFRLIYGLNVSINLK